MTDLQPIETRYNGYRFRSRTEARWAVFFDHLGVAYEYEQEGYELPDGTRYLPDFYLPREDCFFEIKGATPTDADFHKAGLLAHATDKFVDVLAGQPGDHAMYGMKPHRPVKTDLLDWLDACPDDWLRWRTAAMLRDMNRAVPQEYLVREYPNGTKTKPSDTRYHRESGLELDFDQDSHRLVAWRPYERMERDYVVIPEYDVAVTAQSFQGVAWWGRPMNHQYGVDPDYDAERYMDADAPQQSRAYAQAIEAARSARFEHGESGAS